MRLDDQRRSGAQGQILVVFAGGLVTIILMVGLVIDGGTAFLNRRVAQNVADTAALAGTKTLTDHYVHVTKADGTFYNSGDVYEAIRRNVEVGNECRATNVTPCTWRADYVDVRENVIGAVANSNGTIPPKAQGVVVTVQRLPRTFFLGVIGQASWDVSAVATGMTAGVKNGPPSQLLPIATNPPQPFVTGRTYSLTNIDESSGSNPEFGPGNFAWLSWYGTNDPNALANSLCSPDNPEFTFPYQFVGDPGASNAEGVRACLDKWIAEGTTILIPVVSGCDPCNGDNAVFTVVKVAAFVLSDYETQGPAISSVEGKFVEYYSLPTVAAGLGDVPTAADPAVFIGLIR